MYEHDNAWDVLESQTGPSNVWQVRRMDDQWKIDRVRVRLHEGDRNEKLIDCLSISLICDDLQLYCGHLRSHLEDQPLTDLQRLQSLEERMFALESERKARVAVQVQAGRLSVKIVRHRTVHEHWPSGENQQPRFMVILEGERW